MIQRRSAELTPVSPTTDAGWPRLRRVFVDTNELFPFTSMDGRRAVRPVERVRSVGEPAEGDVATIGACPYSWVRPGPDGVSDDLADEFVLIEASSGDVVHKFAEPAECGAPARKDGSCLIPERPDTGRSHELRSSVATSGATTWGAVQARQRDPLRWRSDPFRSSQMSTAG